MTHNFIIEHSDGYFNRLCGLCRRSFEQRVPLRVAVHSDKYCGLVCDTCAEEKVPDLLALVRLAEKQ